MSDYIHFMPFTSHLTSSHFSPAALGWTELTWFDVEPRPQPSVAFTTDLTLCYRNISLAVPSLSKSNLFRNSGMTFSSSQTFHRWISNISSVLLMLRDEFLTEKVFSLLETLMDFYNNATSTEKADVAFIAHSALTCFQSVSSYGGFFSHILDQESMFQYVHYPPTNHASSPCRDTQAVSEQTPVYTEFDYCAKIISFPLLSFLSNICCTMLHKIMYVNY